MNEKQLLITERITTYKKKLSWNTTRLSINLNRLETEELSDDEIEMIEQRIWGYGIRITIYERKIKYHKKILAKLENGKLT